VGERFFWYWPTQVIPKKGPLNGCVCVCVSCCILLAVQCSALTDKTAPKRTLDVPVKNGKGSPYSITEQRVPELIPALGSQPARDVGHKPGGRLPLLSAKPAVTPATLKRAATNFAAW